jgi:poly-beta-1,6-N-acetyl-D-glucosamine synthase
MMMDADTAIDPGLLEAAVRHFTADRALMAIGGLFHGEEGAGILGPFQRNEYIRYARERSVAVAAGCTSSPAPRRSSAPRR